MHTQRYECQGLEVPVEVWGSSSRTLVFLPGLGVHPRYYRKGLERLAHQLRVIVPDLSFRSHARLPLGPFEYLSVAQHIARDLAPDAVWAGHSFGALLALLSDRPAIACAPSVPAPVGLPRMFARAVHMQLRELLGLEGWNGFAYAPQIMADYTRAAVLRPRSVFPSVGSLRAPPTSFQPRSPRAIVYISETDELYRAHEYDAYFSETADGPARGLEIITVTDGHDWPSNQPEQFAVRLDESHQRLAGVA